MLAESFPTVAVRPVRAVTTTSKDSVSRWRAVVMQDGTQEEAGRNEHTERGSKRKKMKKFYRLPSRAYHIYTDYAKRLWTETNTDARAKIANDKVRGAIRNMCHILKSDEYTHFSNGSVDARDKLLIACDDMMDTLPADTAPTPEATNTSNAAVALETTKQADAAAATQGKQKNHRSILFGALMGAAVACWVFSGNYVFTGLFGLMTILGQLEYYRMVMSTSVYPARVISVAGAVSCFFTVSFRAWFFYVQMTNTFS